MIQNIKKAINLWFAVAHGVLPNTCCCKITSVTVASKCLYFHLETKTELFSLMSRECFNFLCYCHLKVCPLAYRWRERAGVIDSLIFPTELCACSLKLITVVLTNEA